MEMGWMKPKGPLDENEKRRLILTLLTRLRCVKCNKPFHPHDFALLDRQQDVWVLSVECRHCGSSAQVIVAIHVGAEPEQMTDLTPEEHQAVTEWPPITTDDVLDVHLFLEEFDGDFEASFSS